MKLDFPSQGFDEAVAAVCHGLFSEEQARALNELLRSDHAARDEYLLRVELHARLASDPDLFAADSEEAEEASGSLRETQPNVVPFQDRSRNRNRWVTWAAAVAACAALLAMGWWGWNGWRQHERRGETSKAVAMLSGVVNAGWAAQAGAPQVGAPLEPGWFRLESGLIQVVFYSGARVVIQGPAEFQIVSSNEASVIAGRLLAEVPPQASGFRILTPQMTVTDLGTVFGIVVNNDATDVHVFEGSVEFLPTSGTAIQRLTKGGAARAVGAGSPSLVPADRTEFASLFNLQDKAVAAESSQYEEWRAASAQLNSDPSLLVHFDFKHKAPTEWRLHNASESTCVSDGTIVGCQWGEGRWPTKPALEFRGVSDRVRLTVPGEFESLTLTGWVRVQGLDRQFNSLFMCDGFEAGTLHWLIREDGVLGLTVIGRGAGNYQIVTSPPVLGLDRFGIWLHLAVVLDGSRKQVSHYVNGQRVSQKALKIQPPFRIDAAELGNWNGRGFPDNDPFMIRNFSGAMDEFCLFSRALSDAELRALFQSEKTSR